MFRNSQVRVQLVNLNNNPQIFRYRDLYASSEVQGISCGSSRYKFRQEFNEWILTNKHPKFFNI